MRGQPRGVCKSGFHDWLYFYADYSCRSVLTEVTPSCHLPRNAQHPLFVLKTETHSDSLYRYERTQIINTLMHYSRHSHNRKYTSLCWEHVELKARKQFFLCCVYAMVAQLYLRKLMETVWRQQRSTQRHYEGADKAWLVWYNVWLYHGIITDLIRWWF